MVLIAGKGHRPSQLSLEDIDDLDIRSPHPGLQRTPIPLTPQSTSSVRCNISFAYARMRDHCKDCALKRKCLHAWCICMPSMSCLRLHVTGVVETSFPVCLTTAAFTLMHIGAE